MKRYIKSSIDYDYEIVITVNFEYEKLSVAASEQLVVHPPPLLRKRQLDDNALLQYNDAIESILEIVRKYFKVLDNGQSPRSYAYYIIFDTGHKAGNKKVAIKFRVSDHLLKGAQEPNKFVEAKIPDDEKVSGEYEISYDTQDEDKTFDKKDYIIHIKSFEISSKLYPSTFDLVLKMDEICEIVSAGDFHMLQKY